MNTLLYAARPMPGATRFAGSNSRRESLDITRQAAIARQEADAFLLSGNGETSTTGHQQRQSVDLEASEPALEQIPLAQPVPIVAPFMRRHGVWEPGEEDLEMARFIQHNAHLGDPHDPNSPTPPNYGHVYPPDHPIHQLLQQQGAQPHYVAMHPQQQAPQRKESFVQALRNHWKAFCTLGLLIAAAFGGEGYAIGNATKHCPAPVNNNPTTTPQFTPPWTPAPTPTFSLPTPIPFPTATDTPVMPPGIGGGGSDDCTNQPDHGDAGNIGNTGTVGNTGNANDGLTSGTSGQARGKGDSANGINKTNATNEDGASQQAQGGSGQKGCTNDTQGEMESALNSAIGQLGTAPEPSNKPSSQEKLKPGT